MYTHLEYALEGIRKRFRVWLRTPNGILHSVLSVIYENKSDRIYPLFLFFCNII